MSCDAKVSGCKAASLHLCLVPVMLCLTNPFKAVVKQCLSNQVLLSAVNDLNCLSG